MNKYLQEAFNKFTPEEQELIKKMVRDLARELKLQDALEEMEAKRLCEHQDIIAYHDNSILCRDCHEVIWQGVGYGERYPEVLKRKLKRKGDGK